MFLDRNCSALTINNNGEAALDLACRFGHVHVGSTFHTYYCCTCLTKYLHSFFMRTLTASRIQHVTVIFYSVGHTSSMDAKELRIISQHIKRWYYGCVHFTCSDPNASGQDPYFLYRKLSFPILTRL